MRFKIPVNPANYAVFGVVESEVEVVTIDEFEAVVAERDAALREVERLKALTESP